MIKYDKKNKKISVPSGLGNLKITVNEYVEYQEAPKCPELEEITITENGVYDGLYNTVIVDVKGYDEGFQQGFDSGVAEQKSKLDQITITKNCTIENPNGYKLVKVNVEAKLNPENYDIKFGGSFFKEVPKVFDFYGVQDFGRMFENCIVLEKVTYIDKNSARYMNKMFYGNGSLKTIDSMETRNVLTMEKMFEGCYSLERIPKLDFSQTQTTERMFCDCRKLKSLVRVNSSNCTNMNNMFHGCSSLETIGEIDMSKVTECYYIFANCPSLTSLPEIDASKLDLRYSYFFYNGGYENEDGEYFRVQQTNLTTLGGFKNLRNSWDGGYGLDVLPNLTYESCINVLNGLYDFIGHGIEPGHSQGTLMVHPNFITKVGDKISIATQKGWSITTY